MIRVGRRLFLGLAASVVTVMVVGYFRAIPSMEKNPPSDTGRSPALRRAVANTNRSPQAGKCTAGYIQVDSTCRPCPNGQFSLPGWISCSPYLNCDEIRRNIRRIRHIASGGVKHVFLAEWNSYSVALNEGHVKSDFDHDVEMLQNLTPHPRVNQPLGSCENLLVAQYHPLSSAEKINGVLRTEEYKGRDTVRTRFQLALDYVAVLEYLHQSHLVMCDSNDLAKTLSQYLITSELRLVVNDLDALPCAKEGEGVKCGHRQLFGDFVAPEELWPYPDRPFVDKDMPGYDEKTDIWKIPPVVEFLLGSGDVLPELMDVHKQCRLKDPKSRPSAKQVLDAYEAVWRQKFST